MNLEYLPAQGILVNKVLIEFGEPRDMVRSKLDDKHKEDDLQIPFDNSEPVWQRRDVYTNFETGNNLFFLGYDDSNVLSEVEVHYCDQIKVLDVVFDFNSSLKSIALQLERYADITKQTIGEYFFTDLKLSIIDKSQLGGEGNTLGYFYCSSDVSHLEG
jgi:hypothetical protein